MASRAIGIVGHSPAAGVYEAGARVLGWTVDDGAPFQVVPAPLAESLALADALIAAGGRTAFGWPLVSTSAVQELLSRARTVGTVTSLSSRSTRPAPSDRRTRAGGVLFQSAHDHVALTLLTAKHTGVGPPRSVSATAELGPDGRDESVDVLIAFDGGLTASVHADWRSSAVVSSEFQLSGDLAVLRTETDPRPALELNGDPVALRAPRVRDEQHRPLHESGVVDMLTTIHVGLDADALPAAFSLTFGREVLEVILSAYRSIAAGVPIALPWTGDRTVTPADILAG